MNNRRKLIMVFAGILIIAGLTESSILAGIPPRTNCASEDVSCQIKSISCQIKSISDKGNAVDNSSVTELPGGNADYSMYEQYGLSYDIENQCYTYHGNVVRFFYDPAAGASFTNFFTGTIDIEAERDGNNHLIGIKECDAEVYDRHTEKYEKSVAVSSSAFIPLDTATETGDGVEDMYSLRDYESAIETGNGIENMFSLQDYESYGLYYNMGDGHWYYNNQRIYMFVDCENAFVYLDDGGSIYLSASGNKEHDNMEIREISETDAQSLLHNLYSVDENDTLEK